MTKTVQNPLSTTETPTTPVATTPEAPAKQKLTKNQFLIVRHLTSKASTINLSVDTGIKIASKIEKFSDGFIERIGTINSHLGISSIGGNVENVPAILGKTYHPRQYGFNLYIYASKDGIVKVPYSTLPSYKGDIPQIRLTHSINQKTAGKEIVVINAKDAETAAGAKLLKQDSTKQKVGEIDVNDLNLLNMAEKDKDLAKALSEDSDTAVLYFSTWTVKGGLNVSETNYKEFCVIVTPSTDIEALEKDIENQVNQLRVKQLAVKGCAAITKLVGFNNLFANKTALRDNTKEKPTPQEVTAKSIRKFVVDSIEENLIKTLPNSFAYAKAYIGPEYDTLAKSTPNRLDTLSVGATIVRRHNSNTPIKHMELFKEIEEINNEVIEKVGSSLQKKIALTPISYDLPKIPITLQIDELNRINHQYAFTRRDNYAPAIYFINRVEELDVTESTRVRVVDLISADRSSVRAFYPSAVRLAITDDKPVYNFLDLGNPVVCMIGNQDREVLGIHSINVLQSTDALRRLYTLQVATLSGILNRGAGVDRLTISSYNTEDKIFGLASTNNHRIFNSDDTLSVYLNSDMVPAKERLITAESCYYSTTAWALAQINPDVRCQGYTTESIEDIVTRNTRVNNIRKAEREVIEEIKNVAALAFYIGLDRMSSTGKPFSISPYGGKEVIDFSLREIRFNNLRLTASNFILTYPKKSREVIPQETVYFTLPAAQIVKSNMADLIVTAGNCAKSNGVSKQESRTLFQELIKTEYFKSHVLEIDKDFRLPTHTYTREDGTIVASEERTPLCSMFTFVVPHIDKKRLDASEFHRAKYNTLSGVYMLVPPHHLSINSRVDSSKSAVTSTIARGYKTLNDPYGPPKTMEENTDFEFDNLLDRFITTILSPIDDIYNENDSYKERFFDQEKFGVGTMVDVTSGTIGVVNFRLQVKLCTASLRYYLNGKTIKFDEIREVLKRALCFQNQEDYNKFISDVSKLSLKARDLINTGLVINVTSTLGAAGTTAAVLEFDKSDGSWDLLIRDKDNKIASKHYIDGGISKFITKLSENRTTTISDDRLYDLLFEQIPTLDMDGLNSLLENGTMVIDKQIARSRKLLEDTVKATKAEYVTCSYGSKALNGYKVKGLSGTEYLIACELGKQDAVKDVKQDHGTERMGAIYALPTLRRICIVDTGTRDQSGYDMIVNRLLAMSNDTLVVGQVTTLQEYTKK